MRPPLPTPSWPTGEARRFGHGVQNELTSGLTRTLGSIPEHRLQQAMRTPLRRPVLETIFWGLPRALGRTRLGEVTSSIRCHVTGRADGGFDVYWVTFQEGRWTASRSSLDKQPDLTVTVDGAELVRLACGKSTPLQAYLAGRLRASGNPVVAARLSKLFGGFSVTPESAGATD